MESRRNRPQLSSRHDDADDNGRVAYGMKKCQGGRCTYGTKLFTLGLANACFLTIIFFISLCSLF